MEVKALFDNMEKPRSALQLTDSAAHWCHAGPHPPSTLLPSARQCIFRPAVPTGKRWLLLPPRSNADRMALRGRGCVGSVGFVSRENFPEGPQHSPLTSPWPQLYHVLVAQPVLGRGDGEGSLLGARALC